MRIPLSSTLAMPLAIFAVTHGGAALGSGAVHRDTDASPAFVAMDSLDVPIVEGDRADGRLKLTLVLQAIDAAHAADIQARLPDLRETELAGAIEFARLHASPSSPVDVARLSTDMSAALRGVDPAIVAVLVVEVEARGI